MYNRNRKLEKRINQIKMSFYKWHGEREEKSLEELASYFNISIEEKMIILLKDLVLMIHQLRYMIKKLI